MTLLSYADVRRMFGWKDNRQVRDRVAKGLLTRVSVGKNTNDWKITKESAEALLQHMKSVADEQEYLRKARAATLRERKGLLPKVSDEVYLDPAEIVRQAREHRGGELPEPEPEPEQTQQRPRQRLGFTQVRGI